MTDTMTRPQDSAVDPDRRAGMIKLASSSFLGNFIEWFDYATYAYFATVIAGVFFPSGDETVSLIRTYAVFAISFIMRPIGAFYWGHFGDKNGRKETLLHSILLMSGASFLIGVLPGFDSIGLLAPGLLLVLRMVQGFSAAGEYAGAATFLSESVGPKRRGLAVALVPASTALGLMAGSAFWLFESSLLSSSAMDSWGWRVPFLLAGPLGLAAFVLRKHLTESPIFVDLQHSQDSNEETPLKTLVTKYPRPLINALGVCVLNAVGYYIVLTYLPTYLTDELNVDSTISGAATTTTLIAYVAFVLLAGAYSDRFGRKRVMLLGCGLFVLLSVPAFVLLGMGAVVAIFVAELGMAALLALNDGNLVSYVPETFPTEVRLSGFAVSFNFANAIFGGTAPLVATVLIKALGTPMAPAWYVTAIAAIAFFAVRSTHVRTDLSSNA